MGVKTQRVVNVGGFTEGQRSHLDFHRNAVLLGPARWSALRNLPLGLHEPVICSGSWRTT
jgi:hypothetical protein